MDLKTQILAAVLTPLAGALALLITKALASATAWMNSKAQESKLARVTAVLPHLVELVWEDVSPELTKEFQAAAADGVFTKDELDRLKADALAALKDELHKYGLQALQQEFGAFTDAFLSKKIDLQIAAIGAPKPAPAPAPAASPQ